jgi:hypothetical protein
MSTMPITDIKVGKRHRRDMGDIKAFATAAGGLRISLGLSLAQLPVSPTLQRAPVPLSQAECRGFLLHVESARWRYHRIGINIA